MNERLDTGTISILLQGSVSGATLGWLAHALVPEREAGDDTPAVSNDCSERPLLRAMANMVILLLAVTPCLTHSSFATALVIPVTVASLLLQLDIANTTRSLRAGGR